MRQMNYREWRAEIRAKDVHPIYQVAAEMSYLRGFHEAIEHAALLVEQLSTGPSDNLCNLIRAIGTRPVSAEGRPLDP